MYCTRIISNCVIYGLILCIKLPKYCDVIQKLKLVRCDITIPIFFVYCEDNYMYYCSWTV